MLAETRTISFLVSTAPGGLGPPQYRGSTITITHTQHSAGIHSTSDKPDAETSTGQHTTLTRDRRPCPRRDSYLHSQQCRTQEFCSEGVQQIQLRIEDRENGDLGGGSLLVRGSGGSCNLVQEISFHIVKFS